MIQLSSKVSIHSRSRIQHMILLIHRFQIFYGVWSTMVSQFLLSSNEVQYILLKIRGFHKKPKILKLDNARSTTMDLIRFFEAVKNPKIAALLAMRTRLHTSSQLMPLGDKVLMLYYKVHLVLCGKIIHVIKISCPIAQMKDNPSCC